MILSTVLILDDVLPCQMAWYLQIIVLFHLGKVQKLLHHNTVMIIVYYRGGHFIFTHIGTRRRILLSLTIKNKAATSVLVDQL